MLVTFHTKAHADILMFGDIAIHLLKMMGHSGAVPGALVAKQVPAALEHLRQAIIVHQMENPEPTEQSDDSGNDQDGESESSDKLARRALEPSVSLAHRALPLIDLLAAAAAAHCDVMWDS